MCLFFALFSRYALLYHTLLDILHYTYKKRILSFSLLVSWTVSSSLKLQNMYIYHPEIKV